MNSDDKYTHVSPTSKMAYLIILLSDYYITNHFKAESMETEGDRQDGAKQLHSLSTYASNNAGRQASRKCCEER